MKTLSNITEGMYGAIPTMQPVPVNPGNGLGVSNHYTPIFNIITNVRNLFGLRLGVIVEQSEDGVGLKLHSSRFYSEKEVYDTLDAPMYPGSYGSTTLRNYIVSQGLSSVKLVRVGTYLVVYFEPTDIRTAACPDECPTCDYACCHEMLDRNIEEAELSTISINEDYDDNEIDDAPNQDVLDIVVGKNKVKAAIALAEIISAELTLPEGYYFKAVKDMDGVESVALRYKYQRRRPFGKTVDLSKSIINIYGDGPEAIWVDVFNDKKSCDIDLKNLVESILRILGAKETEDECVYGLGEYDPNAKEKAEMESDEPEAEDANGKTSEEGSEEPAGAEDQKETAEEPAEEA